MCCVVLAIGINRGTDGDEKEQWMNSKQSMVYYINVVLHYMFYLQIMKFYEDFVSVGKFD